MNKTQDKAFTVENTRRCALGRRNEKQIIIVSDEKTSLKLNMNKTLKIRHYDGQDI